VQAAYAAAVYAAGWSGPHYSGIMTGVAERCVKKADLRLVMRPLRPTANWVSIMSDIAPRTVGPVTAPLALLMFMARFMPSSVPKFSSMVDIISVFISFPFSAFPRLGRDRQIGF
jgi:hypothetical protein